MKANLLAKPSGGRERRAALRLTPDPLLVLELSSGNRGIVLDISEEGLGFVAGAPLDGEGVSVRFRIAARSVELCEAAGHLVWRDPGSQRAGIRFSKVPDELRSIIRACADTPPSAAAEARAEDFSEDQPAEADSGPDPEVARLRAALAARPPLEQNAAPEKSAAHGSYKSRAAQATTMVLACVMAAAVWFPLRQQTAINLGGRKTRLPDIARLASAARQKIVFWYPAAARAAATAMRPPQAGARVAVLRSSGTTSRTASVVPWPALDDPLLNAPRAASSNSLPTSLQAAETVRNTSASVALLATALIVPPAKPPAAPTSAPPRPATPEAATDDTLVAPVERAQTRSLSSAANDSAQTAQALWQETEKGNTRAEIKLAKLYLTGHGVPKSCAQAQVLLNAARTRDSTLAQHTLDDFSKYGCD